jgi:hypothetical protein
LDGAGTPYVGYSIAANFYRISVTKFVEGRKVDVGPPVDPDQAAILSLALDKAGTPYVLYMKMTSDVDSGRLSMKKFKDGKWIPVGLPAFSLRVVGIPALALDAAGAPYVAYMGYRDGNNTLTDKNIVLSVMKFEKGAWRYLGKPGGVPFGEIKPDAADGSHRLGNDN